MAPVEFIEVLNQLWKNWSIQGFMILSLTMQLVLALTAPLRPKTSNFAVISFVWVVYFLADWTAIFALGLISHAASPMSSSYLGSTAKFLPLWASFLLIHIGGPDTITAFALEDNALWVRHFFGLPAQVFAFLLIFIKMIPDKTLLAPTLLVFATGFIKYGERIRALYLASLKNFKDTSIKFYSSDDPSHRGGESEDPGGSDFQKGMHFFEIFKGLIVDIMPNHSERLKSRGFFLELNANRAFEIIEMELNLLYEVFYAKIIAAYSSWGIYIRNFAYFMCITALIIFYSIMKVGLKQTDVYITYVLLAGVIALDTINEVMLAKSNWTLARWRILIKQIVGRCIIPFLMTALMYAIVIRLLYLCGCESIIEKSWSGKMGSFNLLAYSFEEGRSRKRCMLSQCWHHIFGFIHRKTDIELRYIKEEIDKMIYTKKISMDEGIWKHTFDILKERASLPDQADQVKKTYEARGELALQDTSDELKKYVTGFEYDHSVLLWHVATEICYNTDKNLDKKDQNVRFSTILSEYMIYLMRTQPDMMLAVADIFPKRCRKTCDDLKDLEQELSAETLDVFCSKVRERYSGDIEPDHQDRNSGKSVLTDSCRLVRILQQSERKWEIICKVWVELLSYAAGHCRADSHARSVSKGGEFVTFVWLLMAHFGIGPRLPKL